MILDLLGSPQVMSLINIPSPGEGDLISEITFDEYPIHQSAWSVLVCMYNRENPSPGVLE